MRDFNPKNSIGRSKPKYLMHLIVAFSALTFSIAVTNATQAQAQTVENFYPRYFMVPKDNFVLFKANNKKSPKILKEKSGFVLTQMNEEQVLALSELVHDNGRGCGGFVDVQDEVLENKKKISKVFEPFVNPPAQRLSLASSEPRFQTRVNSALSLVQKQRYEQTLKEIVKFPDRYAKSKNGEAMTEFLMNRANTLKSRSSRNDITARKVATPGHLQSSVIITIPGSDPTLPSVVLGAHMDTLKDNMPGADDDGSGTSAILEILQSTLESKTKFKRTLHFAFYAAEELGLYGSKAVAKDFADKKIAVKSVLQLDMIGFKSPKDKALVYFVADNVNPQLTEFTKGLAKTYLNVTDAQIADTKCGYACSDHASWHKVGVPAVFPFEASFENYNKDIHSKNDGMHLIDLDHAIRFTKLGLAFAFEVAEPIN
jgi:leucyl aminopeptidase